METLGIGVEEWNLIRELLLSELWPNLLVPTIVALLILLAYSDDLLTKALK